jgi:hypothetical protein
MKIRGNSIEHELVTESFDSILTNGFLYSDSGFGIILLETI